MINESKFLPQKNADDKSFFGLSKHNLYFNLQKFTNSVLEALIQVR